MAVDARGRRRVARRAGLALAMPALTLALLLGGCRAGARNNGNSNPPVTQNTGANGSSSATSKPSASSNAALQQLENADSQNQSDQQQINNAGSNAGVDFSSQDNPLNP
jgi:hypothetical protein